MTNHTQYKTNGWWQLVKFKPKKKKKKKKKRDLHTMCDKPERRAFNKPFSLFFGRWQPLFKKYNITQKKKLQNLLNS